MVACGRAVEGTGFPVSARRALAGRLVSLRLITARPGMPCPTKKRAGVLRPRLSQEPGGFVRPPGSTDRGRLRCGLCGFLTVPGFPCHLLPGLCLCAAFLDGPTPLIIEKALQGFHLVALDGAAVIPGTLP